jgi:hypothetical protein
MKNTFLLVLLMAGLPYPFRRSMAAQTLDATMPFTTGEGPEPMSSATFETVPKPNANPDVDHFLTSLTPHPYLYFGPSVMGGGYATLAYRSEAGINIESRRWVMKALGAYDDGHKVHDDDQPNPNGHDRYLEGGIYFRLPWRSSFLGSPNRWFLGGGYRWSQLATDNYTKGSNGPLIGGGYDFVLRECSECRRDFSMRITLDWVTAGNDWQNGSQGPQMTFTFPTPRENRHWFFQERVSVYRFHETVTEPNNALLTHQQESQKGIDNFEDLGVFYRF